ncbi:MAG: fibronectin type III domain-containing protein, partial [Defluviitaleaceae bacterium]|nr:fibronectin type III domain-containing protein [Defluviitaleaceae bacterium]
MKNSRIFKRLMAGGLALLFVLGLMPPAQVMANPIQLPPEGFQITTVTGVGNNYQLSMFWQRPPAVPDFNVPPAGYVGSQASWTGHEVSEYHIMRFFAGNAMPPVGWAGWEEIIPPNTSGAGIVTQVLNQTSGPGRFYAYQIRASHWHNFLSNATPPVPLPPVRVTHPPNDSTVFFMTDLEVESSGHGQSMTVSWTRPTFAGSDPFTAYNITIELSVGGSAITRTIPTTPAIPTVAMPGGGQRYVVTLDMPELQPGRLYNVRVEPMIGNSTRETVSPNSLADAFENAHGFPLVHTTNTFIASNVFVRPVLIAEPVGLNYLLLRWGAPEGVQRVRLVQETLGGDGIWRDLAVIDDNAPEEIGMLLINRPTQTTRFRIYFIFPDGTIDYQEVIFDPAAAQFMPTRPNITDVVTNPAPLGMNITWQAFMRSPFNAEEAGSAHMFGGLYRDPDIVYDVWITDDASVFDAAIIPPQFLVAEGLAIDQLAASFNQTDFTYTHLFTEFVNANGVRLPIVPNRVYYIRIVARRIEPMYQISEAAYASHYIWGAVQVPPPVLPRPPLHVRDENHTSITLAWRTQWVEALRINDPPAPGQSRYEWHSAFGLRNGDIVFDYDVVAPNRMTINPAVTPLHTLHDAAAIRAAMGAGGVPLRTQNLPHPETDYEIIVFPLAQIAQSINDDFEYFVLNLINSGNWQSLTVTPGEDFNISANLTGLLPDTTYGIFIRPVNATGEAWWPTFITATTTAERDEMDITPPAPFLDAYQPGDRWLEFMLRPFSTDLRYEFWISEFNNRSTAWIFEPNADYGRMFTYPGGQASATRRIFRADGLFPETTYYIWVRVISPTNRYAWSAPISMQTLPLVIPPPPSGLGLAGQGEVEIINLENDLQLSRVAPDHMIISWSPLRGMPNMPEDENLPMEGITAGAMGTDILGSPLIDYVYMVLFPDLQANRGYWVRARTIFSVHRTGVGGTITEHINYVVEFADNPDFIDATRVYVMPEAEDIAPGQHVRMAISEWAGPFQFFTARDDGEYDGNVIWELFPLPDRDFEIVYTPSTQTLMWRFRSTGVDQHGNRDNLVDQRFISRLVQQRVFEYTIDMTHHNHLPVSNRIVEIPYSIITAFDERGITLSIIAGDTRYTLSPGFVSTSQNTGFGRESRVRLYINDMATLPDLPTGRAYATMPQSVTINVQNPHNMVNLTSLATPITAEHSVNRATAMDFNIGAYVNTPNDVGWRRQGNSFNEHTGVITT